MKSKARIAPKGEKKRCFTCRYNEHKFLENVTFGGVHPVTGTCKLSGKYVTYHKTCEKWVCLKVLEQQALPYYQHKGAEKMKKILNAIRSYLETLENQVEAQLREEKLYHQQNNLEVEGELP